MIRVPRGVTERLTGDAEERDPVVAGWTLRRSPDCTARSNAWKSRKGFRRVWPTQ